MKLRSGSWFSVFVLISGVVFLIPFTGYAQTPINCGEPLAGSISTSGEQDQYTFDASANDGITIRVRKTSGSLIAYLELYNPSGGLITSGAGQINSILTQTGTHRIVVKDQNNTNTGDYVLLWQRMNNPCNATAVDCGQVAAGSIGTSLDPPPWRFHTFTASANDVVTLRVAKTSGSFTAYCELYGPSGSRITSASEITMTLSATGTYTVLVRDYSDTSAGNYVLTWHRVKNPCNPTAINCGEILSGSIGGAGEIKVYTFTASANDGVTIRIRKTSGTCNPYLELYNPNGTQVGSPNIQINAILTVTGTYTVLVRDQYYTNTGSYLLLWQKMNNPCNATAVDCGQVAAGSIGTSLDPPPWRFHTFTASANDVVTLRVAKTSGSFTAYCELYGPSGSRITSASEITMTLSATGTYTILVRDYSDTSAGNYVLTWHRVKNPCNATAIGCGQTLSGSVTISGKMDAYTFTASTGDAVTVRTKKTSGTLSPYVELYNPSGTRVGGPTPQIDMTLSTTGTYTLLMRDQSYVNTGDYLLTWQRFNNPCATAISCGQSASGSIGLTAGAPPWGFYSFTVSASDIVTIRAIKTSGSLAPYLQLYNSSGGLVTSGAGQIDRTMSAGTYVLLMRDQTSTYTGDYAITWQRWNNPSAEAANCGQVMAGAIGITANPPPWRYYSFSASANDSVTIRATKTSGTLAPYLELYSSAGTQVGTAAGQLDRTLTAAGTYTIVVRDQNSINTGNYVLIWHRVNNPCNAQTIACGQVSMGSVATVGEVDAFTFTVSAGDNIVLTLTKTSGGLDPSLELYNASGTRLAYQYTSSGTEVTITQTLSSGGTYTVFVSDYGNDETGSYRLKLQKNNNSCPEVTVLRPNGAESILARTYYTLRWTSTSPQGITSHEIRLSTDGGQTFPTVIATGLGGTVQTYAWIVPADLVTSQGRIRVTATDGSGKSTPDDSDADFTVSQSVGRAYIYDELNRLIQVIYEDGRTVIYTYDAAGNRLILTNE